MKEIKKNNARFITDYCEANVTFTEKGADISCLWKDSETGCCYMEKSSISYEVCMILNKLINNHLKGEKLHE